MDWARVGVCELSGGGGGRNASASSFDGARRPLVPAVRYTHREKSLEDATGRPPSLLFNENGRMGVIRAHDTVRWSIPQALGRAIYRPRQRSVAIDWRINLLGFRRD